MQIFLGFPECSLVYSSMHVNGMLIHLVKENFLVGVNGALSARRSQVDFLVETENVDQHPLRQPSLSRLKNGRNHFLHFALQILIPILESVKTFSGFF